jgi:hypothetical protein
MSAPALGLALDCEVVSLFQVAVLTV